MTDIIRYSNDMNLVQFNKFKDKELDLFFSICYKMKEQGLDEISLDFSELKKLSNYSNRNLSRFIKDLRSTYDKLLALNFEIKTSEDGLSFIKFVLFTKYEVLAKNQIVKIAINKEFEYILNELGTTYTKFELAQFVSLKSVYSKNLFKILKQWDSLKEKIFELEKFKELLNVPKSYSTSDLNKRVLNIVMKELNPYFFDLKLEKIRVGRKIQRLKFSWAAKEMKQAKLIEIEIVISEKMEKTIEKAKKNKFINPILTKENIKKLIEIFDEKILINSFNKAYAEIKKDINFNYLKTYIENSLKQQEIKFVVQTEVQEVEVVKEKEEELKKEIKAPKEKIKVSPEEKKKKYKEYLEKDDLNDDMYNQKGFEMHFNENFEIVEDIEQREDDFNIEKIKEFKAGERLTMQITLEELNKMSFDDIKGTSFEIISEEQAKKNRLIIVSKNQMTRQIIEVSELENEKLLSKNGKKLFGGALISRLKKIAKEERIKIKYKGKIIE